MKHILVIDDSTSTNKAFFEMAKELSRKNKGILVDEPAIKFIEEVEDKTLIKAMKKASKEGFLDGKEKAAFLARIKKDAR